MVAQKGAEASRKLQALTGTISGTIAAALRQGLEKSVNIKGKLVARDRIELSTLRFSVNFDRNSVKVVESFCKI